MIIDYGDSIRSRSIRQAFLVCAAAELSWPQCKEQFRHHNMEASRILKERQSNSRELVVADLFTVLYLLIASSCVSDRDVIIAHVTRLIAIITHLSEVGPLQRLLSFLEPALTFVLFLSMWNSAMAHHVQPVFCEHQTMFRQVRGVYHLPTYTELPTRNAMGLSLTRMVVECLTAVLWLSKYEMGVVDGELKRIIQQDLQD
jgi:hypothetical protein